MPERHQFQYLQSLDSVRMPYPGRHQETDRQQALRRLHELQVFLEVVLALALGRQVAVPQSYAFDSFSFLRIARRILEIRDRVPTARHVHPFRLHLIGDAYTFDDAINSMLARAHRGTFVSQILPELADPVGYDLDPVELRRSTRDVDALMQRPWLDGERSEALRVVRSAFRDIPAVPARPASLIPLRQMISNFIHPSTGPGWPPADQRLAEVHGDLLDALRRLGPFDSRSGLRAAAPWPGGDGWTVSELLGAEQAALVVEFVDTLYNLVVNDSIGVAAGTFTTTLGLGNDSLLDRLAAQRLGHAFYQWLMATVPVARPTHLLPVGTGDTPLFDIELDSIVMATDPAARRPVERLLAGADNALGALFEQLAADGRHGRRSRFWVSQQRMVKALASGDRTAAEAALGKHLSRVARILGARSADIKVIGDRIGLALNIMNDAGAIEGTATTYVPMGAVLDRLVGSLPAGSAILHTALAVGGLAVRRHRARRLAHAMGTAVTLRDRVAG